MPSLPQLLDGTNAVLPVAITNFNLRLNAVESVRVATLADVPAFSIAPTALFRWAWAQALRITGRGSSVRLITSTIRSAQGASPTRRVAQSALAYEVQIAFLGLEPGQLPDVDGNVGVRCSCPAYYFWFSYANQQNGCSFGTRFAPYVRKTPPDDPRYPPKNPNNIPGMCKHLILLSSILPSMSVYRMTT
jgi:hypothetical protein